MSSLNSSLEECAICLESLPEPIRFQCHPEALCRPCFRQYLLTSFKQLSYQSGNDVRCPICQSGSIPLDDCLKHLEPQDLENTHELLFQTYLRQTKDIQRCPLSTCSFAYLPQKCLLKKQSTCPLCYTHLSSPFSLSLTPLITFIYITFMTNNCPQCDIPIDKLGGCYHMTCSCRHEFCWYCLKDYRQSDGSMYEQHNSKECLFLILTKIVTLILVFCCLVFVYSGNQSFNGVLSYGCSILISILRVVAIDGAIVSQVMLLHHSFHRTNYFKKLLVMVLGMDILALTLIYWFGDLAGSLYIIGVSLVCAGVSVGIGMMVQFSVATWFSYIT